MSNQDFLSSELIAQILQLEEIETAFNSRSELIQAKYVPQRKVYSTNLYLQPQQFSNAFSTSEAEFERYLEFQKDDISLVKVRKAPKLSATRVRDQSIRFAQKANEVFGIVASETSGDIVDVYSFTDKQIYSCEIERVQKVQKRSLVLITIRSISERKAFITAKYSRDEERKVRNTGILPSLDFTQTLPSEVSSLIFSYLNPSQVGKVLLTCKGWKQIVLSFQLPFRISPSPKDLQYAFYYLNDNLKDTNYPLFMTKHKVWNELAKNSNNVTPQHRKILHATKPRRFELKRCAFCNKPCSLSCESHDFSKQQL